MTPAASYAERLVPGLAACLVIAGLIAMISIAYGAAFGSSLGWALFLGLSITLTLFAYFAAPRIAVTPEGLCAGAARLPWECVGSVVVLDRDGMRRARGAGADARTYLVLRPWAAPGGILVDVQDPQDPHPAWLITSRRPIALADAIASAHPAR